MTKTDVLKSRMTGNCHVRFGSGGEGGDSLTDHNYAAHYVTQTGAPIHLPPLDDIVWLRHSEVDHISPGLVPHFEV